MRITFITLGFRREVVGGIKVLYEYANRMAERGHHVTILHPRRVPILSVPDYVRRVLAVARNKPKQFPGYILNTLRNARVSGPGLVLVAPEVGWFSLDRRVKAFIVPSAMPRYVSDGESYSGILGRLIPAVLESLSS